MTLSNDIYLAQDEIKTQITNLVKDYLELENVDLTKTSFLSYVIDILTKLTSNAMFYQSSTFKEFFLTQAQLPDSVYSLSSFLGYSPSDASYATANILMTIPLTFEGTTETISIPSGFVFQTKDKVIFETYYDTEITIVNNTSVEIIANTGTRVYNLPVSIDTTADVQFQFVLPVRQHTTYTYETQIDADIQTYQFPSVEITLTDKLSSLALTVDNVSWSAFDSLFLMSSTDTGYVSKKSINGRKLYFGNGLIGVQPDAGASIIVTTTETKGADGNVIVGTITKGDRLYSTNQVGDVGVLSYTATNPSPATGGSDEESTQETRSNAIANLTSLNRLVSEDDYQNVSSIITNVPFAGNTIPVLKRSDLKVNEIQLFSGVLYDNSLIPTNNVYKSYSVGSSISRDDTISFDGTDYTSLFDITVDDINTTANYSYVAHDMDITPTLVQVWTDESHDDYNIILNEVAYTKAGSAVTFTVSYYSTEPDFDDVECEMRIINSDTIVAMTNNPASEGGTFTYTFSDYTALSSGTLNITFTLSNPNLSGETNISQYSMDFILQQTLEEMMLSNVVTDGTTDTIYAIPVGLKSYYDGLSATNKKQLELTVLQEIISTMDLVDYRMITDFVNFKFCNTSGSITNMQFNETTKTGVINIGITSLPGGPTLGDRHIVGDDKGSLSAYKDYIAVYTASGWVYNAPNLNDVIYASSTDTKYVYSDLGWIDPSFPIPLSIHVEVIRESSSSVTSTEIISNIKEDLLSAYTSSFGPNMELYRSEIINIVKSVTGVTDCRVLTPECSIFFDYSLTDFTQTQLLQYTPEWIYFESDDITVTIITVD